MRSKTWLLGALASGGALIGAVAVAQVLGDPPVPPVTAQAQADCTRLAGGSIASGFTVVSAAAKPADPKLSIPAHCEVAGTLSPVAGSTIAVVVRLPDTWNGKLLGLGGGGWAGNVTLLAAAPGLVAGYATAQTDGGHPSTSAWDTDWVTLPNGRTDLVKLEDFSSRAIHLTAATAKQVVRAFYGRAHSRAYYQGCSTGGRMGLIEAQRFPDDYDGIIAGAPVYSLKTQSTGLVRANLGRGPGGQLTPAQSGAVAAAALRACDAKDGIADGIIADPPSCKWDPAVLQCGAGATTPTCLSAAQVNTVRTLYAGVKTKDGIVAAYPAAAGSEGDWTNWFLASPDGSGGALPGLRAPLFDDPGFTLAGYDPDTHQAKLESSAFSKMYEAKDPDLARFTARGGKLILWHGGYDAGPSPDQTVAYYRAVEALGGTPAQSVRLFLAPGVGHCRGGPGPDRFDMLGALDTWVEKGDAPAQITASRADRPMTRPLCPYPQRARYLGKGNPDDAASFRCG